MPPSPCADPSRLLHVAYRAAARVVHNPLLAEEAGERALHRLQLAMLAGQVPDKPEAWIRIVARRSACALLRTSWAHVQPIHEDTQVVAEPSGREDPLADQLRAAFVRSLTPRQREAFEAALSCRTTKDAARTCGMEPRDFRRYVVAISRRVRRRLPGLVEAQRPRGLGRVFAG